MAIIRYSKLRRTTMFFQDGDASGSDEAVKPQDGAATDGAAAPMSDDAM